MMTTPLFETAAAEEDGLRIELLHPPAMYYALVHNRVPVVRHLSVENSGDEAVRDIEVILELLGPDGPLCEAWRRRIPVIEGKDATGWDEFPGFTPDTGALKRANEAFPVDYRITVRAADQRELVLRAPSRVLAHNEWFNAPALFESVAAFVQPNTGAVIEVLRSAARLLERDTGSGSLQGYQAGPRRAAQIGAAIYEALREQKIGYLGLPASFEETGQKIRTTAAVLRDRLGNCIDLSVTYAACLEQAGLHPLIWIVEGHAFAGFFLHEDRLPETVSFEPAQMINLVESEKAVAVELTGVAPGGSSLAFPAAVAAGRAHLRGPLTLHGMVDIHLAHRSGIRPLPSADTTAPAAALDAADQAIRTAVALPADLEIDGALDQEENLEPRAAEDDAPARVRAWRRALLDLSLRNPLLKLPKRGKGVDLHTPAGSLAELDDLVHQGKAVHVVAQDTLGGLQELRGVRRAQDLPDEVIAEELTRDRRVYAAVTQAGYVARMRGLQRDARTLQQETGGNYLYLTLGALVHPTPSGEAHAPLFLLPVRIEGGTGRRPYTIVIDGAETAAPNYCLVQWLRVRHGVRIRELEDPITDDAGIDITASLRAIRKALIDNDLNYRIDESASLRLLQFSTFQMWRDLTDHWQVFERNEVVRHLVHNSGQPFRLRSGLPDVSVDESALHLPIAADGSQMRAVALAEQGHSFVLEGPPGTGKSQTITNLIAHAVRSGKTVLFVAEKQAALEVVKRRLAAIGLTDFCLDLHGRKQSLRSIHQQLKASLEHQGTADEHSWDALTAGYRARIATLSRYPGQLHDTNAAGFSAWSAYQAKLAHGDGPAAVVPPTYFTLDAATRAAIENTCRELPAAARSAQIRPGHHWSISGVRVVDGLDGTELGALAAELETLRQQFEALPQALRAAIAALPHPTLLGTALEAAALAHDGVLPDFSRTTAASHPGWDAAVAAALHALADFHQRHQPALTTFQPGFFSLPGFTELEALASEAATGLLGKKKRRMRLVEALQPHVAPGARLDETSVLEAFQAAVAARTAAAALLGQVQAVPGLALDGTWLPTLPDSVNTLQTAAHRLTVSRRLLGDLPALWRAFAELGPRLPQQFLTRLTQTWARWLSLLATTDAEFSLWSAEAGWTGAWARDGRVWAAELGSLGILPIQRWGALLRHCDILAQAGLSAFRRQILEGELPADDLELAFLRGQAQSALEERLTTNDLRFFDTGAHEQQVGDYLRLSDEVRAQYPHRLDSELVAARPAVDKDFQAKAGELVRRLNSRRDKLSFRDACALAPEIVTTLTPCFLMSPASVANFLKPGAVTFDIVVFDEASQIRVAQAVGAMGRGRSVVVVGDSKQMPPTSIMEASHTDDNEELTSVPEDLDSILAECVESGLPRESLTWHYRSTDESLISFSNSHYYEDKLASLPSPGGEPESGISWRRIDGHYDRGATRTNRLEAEAVVTEIERLLENPATASRSIGVVTFNIQQRDLLLNLLEESTDERIQAALTRQDGEELFVKNLENVQGDERDVILFSLAFSRNVETGQLPLNFGPLTLQGGERRLNVAITRARTQVIVFSSFAPSDIDLSRTNSVGLKHLRAYLEVAAGGVGRSGDVASRGNERVERVVQELAAALTARNYAVETNVGLSQFTIDLTVSAPGAGRRQVAVLLDGPAWARRPTVADRDATPVLLEKLMHWERVVRVWLPEWIIDREAVLRRIEDAIAAVPVRPAHAPATDVRVTAEPAESELPAAATHAAAAPDRAIRGLVPVAESSQPGSAAAVFVAYEPEPLGTREQIDRLAEDKTVQRLVQQAIAEVIDAEGPIELERLSRLVHRRFGLHRVREDRRNLLLRQLPKGYLVTKGLGRRYAWPAELDPQTWQGFRRTQASGDRAFHEIAPEEIANAMRFAAKNDPNHDAAQLRRATMNVLGYRKGSPAIEDTLRHVMRGLAERGEVKDH
ncbi:DUF4011 domain-containing protein [Amycolatopsis deserti]|uniref:DUF4011 domain-containing protein n=1 Tax=Amycolatopsis deserti TaxID=185696 RepID=UPI001E5CF339|nr:DUF4011 domain-containing protein [Amycolatopsis deserti]